MRASHRYMFLVFSSAVSLIALDCAPTRQETAIDQATPLHQAPNIFPDIEATVIPPNIAPLNFVVNEPGMRYYVRIHSTQGKAIEIRARTPGIVIPFRPWKEMLHLNAGEKIYFDVYARRADGQWYRFDTITSTIAKNAIDGYLVYRLLKPLFNRYTNMGIFQRDLQNYDETIVLHNSTSGRCCLNCHAFLNNRPDSMALHIRAEGRGKPMLVVRNGDVATVTKPAGYLSWHPSGRLLAFSVNKLSLFYHSTGEPRDVFDAASDLGVYVVDSNTMVMPAKIAVPDTLETWPAWSHDGQYLYFCSAPKLPIERFNEIKYSLMRIRYDLESNTWGNPETVLSAQDTKLSITEPKLSPDGRFLLFCMSQYGNFPVYQDSSDLYLMDLKTSKHGRLEINSNRTESWHSWSSNSRWIVFSSKRRDGLFARPYFSYVTEDGTVHKPILLPQRDPTFYDRFIKTYNVPELIREPIRVRQRDLARAVVAPRKPLTPDINTQQEEPYQGSGSTRPESGQPSKE